MKSRDQYEWQFRNEIAGALKIRPSIVSISDYRRGSVIGSVALAVTLAAGFGWANQRGIM